MFQNVLCVINKYGLKVWKIIETKKDLMLLTEKMININNAQHRLWVCACVSHTHTRTPCLPHLLVCFISVIAPRRVRMWQRFVSETDWASDYKLFIFVKWWQHSNANTQVASDVMLVNIYWQTNHCCCSFVSSLSRPNAWGAKLGVNVIGFSVSVIKFPCGEY